MFCRYHLATLLSLVVATTTATGQGDRSPLQNQRYTGQRYSAAWLNDNQKEQLPVAGLRSARTAAAATAAGKAAVAAGTTTMTRKGPTFGRSYLASNMVPFLGQHEGPTTINYTLTPANVTGQLGATVYLHCYVHNIGQKTVTWLRRSDYHILTVGMVTFSTDERFSAVRGEGLGHVMDASAAASATFSGSRTNHGFQSSSSSNSKMGSSSSSSSSRSSSDGGLATLSEGNDWMLQIRGVQKADAGEYECQVNTHYPMLSAHVNLHVLSPHASIAEGAEVYVNGGSVVSVTCIIDDCSEPPSLVFWYHGERVINYDTRNARINITTYSMASRVDTPPQLLSATATAAAGAAASSLPSLDSRHHHHHHRWVSRLLIQNAGREDSGSYTCAPVDSAPAVVQVHVLQEEEQLARQSSSEASEGASTQTLLTLCTLGPLLALQMAFLLVVARST